MRTDNILSDDEFYLQNLLFDALPSTQEKFEKVYIDHLRSIVDIVFSKEEKAHAKMRWGKYTDYVSINEIDKMINIVIANKDVIFNGLDHSNLIKEIKSDYSRLGMKRSTIDNLIKAEFYSKEKILNTSVSNFIHILNEKIPTDQIGKTYEDTVRCLNRAGYDTSKLGFPGKNSSSKHLSEKEFKQAISDVKESKNFHDISSEINCPHCGKRIRITTSKV